VAPGLAEGTGNFSTRRLGRRKKAQADNEATLWAKVDKYEAALSNWQPTME
jgi:hypothetical protein